jgi:MFS family permease
MTPRLRVLQRQRIPPAVAIGAYFFVNGATYASWVPRLPQIKSALRVTDTQLGLTLIGGVVGSLIMSFAFAPAVHRFGSRRMTMVSSVMLTLLLPLIALAPSAVVLFGALACLGTVDGFADVAVNSQALQLQRQRSNSIINRLHGTWSLGALTGGLVAGRSAAAGISVRTQLLGTSLVLLCCAAGAVR